MWSDAAYTGWNPESKKLMQMAPIEDISPCKSLCWRGVFPLPKFEKLIAPFSSLNFAGKLEDWSG